MLLELEIHQLELSIQNEELLTAHLLAERARVEYADLYEYAPVAYLTMTAADVVEWANQRADALLDTEATWLVRRRFVAFVSPPPVTPALASKLIYWP